MVETAITLAFVIILAVLMLRFWVPVLLIGIFLGSAGLILAIGIVPAVDAYLRVKPENPEAPLVFAVIIALFGAVAAVLHFWYWNTTKKEVLTTPSAALGATKEE
jgi:hypothetical protein